GEHVRRAAAGQLRPHSRLQSGDDRQSLLCAVRDISRGGGSRRGPACRARGIAGSRILRATRPAGGRWLPRHRLAKRKAPIMNTLHRERAPISDAAWAQIDEEASRTLKRYLAGRRVVDLQGPSGVALAAVGTGHLQNITAPGTDILARQREVRALVELRVPFDLDRQMIDDVERGSKDSDWQPAKDAARRIAFAEDRAI